MPLPAHARQGHHRVRLGIELATCEACRPITGLNPTEAKAVEFGPCPSTLDLASDALRNGMPLPIGEHTGLGQRLAVWQADEGYIADGINVLVAGLECALIHGHPTGLVGQGRLFYHARRLVGRHASQKIKGCWRVVRKDQLLPVRLDVREVQFRVEADVPGLQHPHDRSSHRRSGYAHRQGFRGVHV